MENNYAQNKLCKIIYFDEDSVTDYLQLMSGGALEKTTELLDSTTSQKEVTTNAGGRAGIGGIFKALLGLEAELSVGVSVGGSFNRDKMIKNIIKNTILTDFVNILDGVDDKKAVAKLPKGTVKKFQGYKISVERESLSYFVMVSPYMNMFQTGSIIPSGELNISLDKLDNVLRNAKGYYEFIGVKGKGKVVLRFNINSFKFLDAETLERLAKVNLIKDYLEQKKSEMAEERKLIDNPELLINGRQLTNIGVFREYVFNYLKNNRNIDQEGTILVRQLENTPQGMPLEIYCFTNDSEWGNYEDIQADIFDHLLVASKEFDLEVIQFAKI